MKAALTATALLMLAACGGPTPEPAVRADSPSEPAPAARESVTLIDFSDQGDRAGQVTVPKLVLSEQEWRRRLTPLAFSVTRHKETEVPFTGRYNKHSEAGIYRCVGCGTALFHSEAKFDSHSGWPSYTAPIAAENLYTLIDVSLGIAREEVLCRRCDAHLGHVFPDGPEPTGLRYCINSAALRFVAFSN